MPIALFDLAELTGLVINLEGRRCLLTDPTDFFYNYFQILILFNAFKMNAWMQSSNLTEDEAKQKYINLVEKHLK